MLVLRHFDAMLKTRDAPLMPEPFEVSGERAEE